MFADLPVLAGSMSTAVFVASTMPMLIKALRTRDLSSYSAANLLLSNVGNLLYAMYVISLPPGPAWALYGFNMSVSAAMFALWLRYRSHAHEVTVAPTGAIAERGEPAAMTGDRVLLDA